MKKILLLTVGFATTFILGFYVHSFLNSESSQANETSKQPSKQYGDVKLGAFSASLSVKDLKVSKAFYEKLGFVEFGGGMSQNYLIMKNGNALIGLFQGMFEGNILTFNPGWDENAKDLEHFDDIRTLQKRFLKSGITLTMQVDEQTKGPASMMLNDPDGNSILFDQHR
jgi:predicted enzyme related to lactoylglutathione lyase